MAITEREAEYVIDQQLSSCGWQLNAKKPRRNVYKQQARTNDQNKAMKGRPDYILYAYDDSDKPSVVIEAKKPGESMDKALRQGIRSYAKKINAPIVVATDGWRVKTWHLKYDEPLFVDGREVDELFSPAMTKSFIESNHFSSFSKEVAIEQDELIKKFKKANAILKLEGLSAGIERFSEFANLMFLKLKMEADGSEIAGFSWADIENKQDKALLRSIRQVFSELRREHSTLFEQTKIHKPQHMERLIELLSSFRLSAVRDDIKGLAFEHFIHSYTRGTKNDLGQYFTPRHIVRMMVHFLKPQIGETVYDPFCGTGGMLIECFRYIKQHASDTKEHRNFLRNKTLWGRDNSSVARIAMMNMIMFGDGHSNIEQGDSYALLGKTKNEYDIVITNIPFSQETDYVGEYPIAPTGSKNGDSIAVQHCLESLKNKPTARAAIIVPIGFLYKSQLEQERKYICRNWQVERVVELSPKCFQPYTEQQTAVLVVRRANPTTTFLYFKVSKDGYSQDGYRVPLTGENDIDRAMDDIGGQKQSTERGVFKNIDLRLRKGHRRLKEIAKVTVNANNISPKTKIDDVVDGVHPLFMVADLARHHIDYALEESNYKLNDRAVQKKNPYLFKKDTVLIPVTGKASLKNHRALLAIPGYATSTLAGIEAEKIHPYCLFYFFLYFDVQSIILDEGYPGITKATLEDIPIPHYTDRQEKDIIQHVSKAVQLAQGLKQTQKDLEQVKDKIQTEIYT